MKKQMGIVVVSLLMAASAFANELLISPGQSVRVKAKSDTVVSCEGQAAEPAGPQEIARACRCYTATFVNAGGLQTKALLEIIYDSGSRKEVELRSFDYSSDYKEKCERFIRQNSSCQ